MAMSDFQIQSIRDDALKAEKKLEAESYFLLEKLNKVLKKSFA